MNSLNPGSSRRLTGPNRWTMEPAAIVEVRWPKEPSEETLQAYYVAWANLVGQTATLLNWPPPQCQMHREEQALMMTFLPPLDGLYTGCEIAELALQKCCQSLPDNETPSLQPEELEQFTREYEQERNPALLALAHEATQHKSPFLWDDDHCSLGFGKYATTWSVRSLPKTEQLSWEEYQSIPAAFITGTNGKTTTSRMLTRILRKQNLQVGSTSTDGLCFNEEMLETGDWTGPGGARTILRNKNADVAILETARGGILRRGLATTEADVALLTNVSDDHLGEWGIETIEQMAEVKFLIRHGIRKGGLLLLNADSEPVVNVCKAWSHKEKQPPFRIGWWTTQHKETETRPNLPLGEMLAWFHHDTQELCFAHNQQILTLPASDVPSTLHGLAEHNVSNALSAGLAALEMGCTWPAIQAGLRSFAPSVKDNPGRANLFSLRGARLIIDFGHNPDGIRMMSQLAQKLQPTRTLILVGQAGDRNNQAIQDLAVASMVAKPNMVVIKRMEAYLRGRQSGEIQDLLEKTFLDLGQPQDGITRQDSESESIAFALQWAQPNDLILLFVQESFQAAVKQLLQAGAQEGWPKE